MIDILNRYKSYGCILRIERDNGYGMYSNDDYYYENGNPIQPTVVDEIRNNLSDDIFRITEPEFESWIKQNDIYFGFKTFTQLKKWFTMEEREQFKQLGYKLKVYYPDEIWCTDKQAFFVKHGDIKSKEVPDDRW